MVDKVLHNALEHRVHEILESKQLNGKITIGLLNEFVQWLRGLQFRCSFTNSVQKKGKSNRAEIDIGNYCFYINNKKNRDKWGRFKYIEYESVYKSKDNDLLDFIDGCEIKEILKKQKYKLDVMIYILVKCDVIELIQEYSWHNERSRQYVFTEKFIEDVLDALEVTNEDIYPSNWVSHGLGREFIPTTERELFLYNKLMSNEVRIDRNFSSRKAIVCLNNSPKIKEIDTEMLKPSLNPLQKKILKNKKMNYIFMSIMALEDFRYKRNIYVKEDKKSGRLYSSFSSFPKVFRRYIQIKWNKNFKYLANLDLKSAQPFLLLTLLRKEINNDNPELLMFEDIIINHDIYNYCLKNQIPYKQRRNNQYIKNGKLQYFTEVFEGEKIPINDRERMKKEFMHYMFYKPSKSVSIPLVGQIMQKYFPTIHNTITKLKNESDNFAIDMQKLEAKLFVDTWWSLKDFNILPLHDSLYFISSHQERVVNALRKSFSNNKIACANLHLENVCYNSGEIAIREKIIHINQILQ